MSEYIINGSTLTAMADEVRTLSGKTENMLPNTMTSNIREANSEISNQASLISQIKTALEGKVGNGPEQICDVSVCINADEKSLEQCYAVFPVYTVGSSGNVYYEVTSPRLDDLSYKDGKAEFSCLKKSELHIFMPAESDYDYDIYDNNAIYTGFCDVGPYKDVCFRILGDTELYCNIQSATTIISFNIDGASYQAEEGMTWSEWCSSSYNDSDFAIGSDNKVHFGPPIIVLQGVECNSTDVILNGANYESFNPDGAAP